MVSGGTIVSSKLRVLIPPLASATVTVRANTPDWFGVPVMAPVVASSCRPAGRPVALHTNGVAPPAATMTDLGYGVPTTPLGRVAGALIERAGATDRVYSID